MCVLPRYRDVDVEVLTCLGDDLARQRCDTQCSDAVSGLAQDVKTKAVKGEALTRFRDRARFMNDDPGYRRRLIIRNIPVHRPVKITYRNRAIDVDRAIRQRPHARHGDIVLVGDVTDNLLYNIFQRDQALKLTIFVDNQSEWRLAVSESL